ncbi:MAG: copper resistance protein CopB [Sphingomonadales bacterium]|nr:MAG: copper resistance protein CopB [Sphingomonadales bacterium]
MNSLLLAASAITGLALTAPVLAQDHSQHMPGMNMPAPAASSRPKPKTRKAPRQMVAAPRRTAPQVPAPVPTCLPEHAAMGHCAAEPPAGAKVDYAPPQEAPSASADPACPPEHAAMGHCTPKSAATSRAPLSPGNPACPPEHAAMGHCSPSDPAIPAAAHTAPGGTALAAGKAPAPAPPEANYADRIWGREAMAPARDLLRREHGGMAFSQVMFDLAEVQIRDGRDGYRWGGELWYGGDINRLIVKSEGEGTFREDAEGEIQALYSRAVGAYFNLQAGIRQDFVKGPDRTYATIGFEGLAPYWFELEGALFVSDRGDVLGRFEGYYDQRITQRLIVQPRAEINLSAQDVPAGGLGSGLTDAELGLRLRYEIAREFAPYVGVSWERKFGDTARFSRAAGDGTGGFSFVAGIRAWF